MAWTPPKTWITDEFVDAAELNAHLRDNLLAISSQPACRVFHNTTQAALNGLYTSLTFNTEIFDTDAIHDNATNPTRLTCKTAGKYLIGGSVEIDGTSGGTRRYLTLRVNGATYLASNGNTASAFPAAAGSDEVQLAIVSLYQLAVNDYVELQVFHDHGADRLINTSNPWTPSFWMQRMSD